MICSPSIYKAPPMAKQLIINAIEPREIRAAIVEDGEPINFFVERSTRKFQKGNIYRARITSIEPHLQAAFVELEKGQHGFLSLSDVIFPDGGISLINGLPAPSLPEVDKSDKKGAVKEEPRRHEEKVRPKIEVPPQKQAVEKKTLVEAVVENESSSEDLAVESFYDDSPEVPVVLTPKPLRVSLSPEAGNWILGLADQMEPAPLIEEIGAEEVVLNVESTENINTQETLNTNSAQENININDIQENINDIQENINNIQENININNIQETLNTNNDQENINNIQENIHIPVQETITSEPEDSASDTCVDTAIFEIDGENETEDSSNSSEAESHNLDDAIDDDDLDEEPDLEKSDSDDVQTSGSAVSKSPKRHGKGSSSKGAFAHKRRPFMRIENVLEVGQYICVQIIKEGIGNKAPMVTTFISLAGHYMVLTPGGDRSGVSKQVQSQAERSRLRNFIEKSPIPDRCGLIVRTAAEGVDLKDLELDIAHLCDSWKEIQDQFRRTPRSGIVRKEENLTTRLVRDYYNQDIDEIWIDDRDTHEEIRQFFERGMSDQVQRVKLYTGERPIFYNYNLDKPLQGLFQRRVNLPGGGSLVFDQGEAMLVIDVNSGTFRDGEDDEDTAFKLNLLACKEVARQVQMRDVGGIVMVDFVDMRRISNRSKVEKELEKAFKGDKAKLNVMSIGPLGVLQMSRQRTKDSLRGSLYSTCEVCDGTGLVPSKVHSAMGILREIRGNLRRFNGTQLKIATTAEMATEMFNLYKSELVKMEEEENCQIAIEIDGQLGHGEFKLISKGSPQRPQSGNPAQSQNAHIGHAGHARSGKENFVMPRKETSVMPRAESAVAVAEGERRNKKKRKRNKQRDEQGNFGEGENYPSRPARVEGEVSGPPLGIIKSMEPRIEQIESAEPKEGHEKKEAPVLKQVSQLNAEAAKNVPHLAPSPAKTSIEEARAHAPVEPQSSSSNSSKQNERPAKINSAQRRSQRNSPGKSKEKNKAKKVDNKDLNKAESAHISPPASEKE